MQTELQCGDAIKTVDEIVNTEVDRARKEIFQLMKDGTDAAIEDFKHLEHRCNVLTVMVVVQYIALALLALCK